MRIKSSEPRVEPRVKQDWFQRVARVWDWERVNRNARTLRGAWRHVRHRIGFIFALMNRLTSDILNGDGHQLNRWPKEVKPRRWCWQRVQQDLKLWTACGGALMVWMDSGSRRLPDLWMVYWSVRSIFQKNEICREGLFGWIFFFFFEMQKRKERVAR